MSKHYKVIYNYSFLDFEFYIYLFFEEKLNQLKIYDKKNEQRPTN